MGWQTTQFVATTKEQKKHTKAEDGLEFAFGDCRGNGFNIYAFWVHSALNPMDFVFVCFVSLLSHSLYFFLIFFLMFRVVCRSLVRIFGWQTYRKLQKCRWVGTHVQQYVRITVFI